MDHGVTIEELAATCGALIDEIEKAVVGKRPVLELVLAGLLADGYVLVEDVPGVAVVRTDRDGDSAVVEQVRRATAGGRRATAVTADRGLSERVLGVGGRVMRPGALLEALDALD